MWCDAQKFKVRRNKFLDRGSDFRERPGPAPGPVSENGVTRGAYWDHKAWQSRLTDMIRTLAFIAALAAPALAAAQTDSVEDAAEAAASPFRMTPAPSRAAFTPPASHGLLERPSQRDLSDSFEARQADAEIRNLARQVDMMEGPLNGQWTLVGPAGEQLYAFQLTSSVTSGEPLSGAWRNLRVARSATSAGFLALVGYDGAQLSMRFIEQSPQDLVAVNLMRDPAGRFTGQLTRNGATIPVVLQPK
jgi:hypothetical protein